MRRSFFIAIGVFAFVAVLMTAAVLLLPAERIGAFAAARASAALGRDVQVQRFSVRLLPRPAVSLAGVVVAGRTPADSALMSADRVELRPRLLPLLRRRVIIDEIALERPVLRIEIDADSTSNIPPLTTDSAAAGAGGDVELNIQRLRVSDGVVSWRDATTGTAATLAGITQNLNLSGSVMAGELVRLAAAGDLEIADIDIDAPAQLAWPVRDLRLRVEHDVDVDRAGDRIALNTLKVTLQEIALDVSGTITAFTDSLQRTVDLRARTGSVDVAQFVASLPQSLLTGSSGDVLTGAAGRAQLEVAVAGRLGAGSIPEVAGTLRIEDAALARGRHGTIASGLDGTVAFSLDSVASDGITGSVLGEPLHIMFNVHNPGEPNGRVSVRAALALAEAQKLGLLPDSVHGSGRVAIDITAAGSMADAAEAMVNGSIDMTGVEVRVAALKQPVVVRQGRITLDGRSAAANDLRAGIGASDVALDFSATEWLPYALGDTLRPPVITFDARSELFDADEILGVNAAEHTYGELFFARLADRELDGKTAAQVAEELGLGMPEVPPVTMDGRIRAARFVRGAVPLNDVDITIAARSGEVDVRAASFRMMGGGVNMTGRLGLAAAGSTGATQPLALDYTINDVAAGMFLERFTAFRDHMTGKLLLTGTMSMLLDQHLLPVRESVNGGGTAAVLEGEIVNWPLLRRLGERIGIAKFDTLDFRDWSGRYSVTGPKVVLEESMLESGELGVRAAGSFDLNGTLDMGATLYMPPEWTARLPGAQAAFLTSAAAGDDGRVPIGARFTGSARDPSVSIDMSEAGTRIADAAREAAAAEAREAAASAASRLAERFLPKADTAADTAAAPITAADSAKMKVEADVRNRLRRIIKPGGN